MAAGAALVTAAVLELTLGLRVPGPRSRQPPPPPVWIAAPMLGGAVEAAAAAVLCLLTCSAPSRSRGDKERSSGSRGGHAEPGSDHAGTEPRLHGR